MQKFAGEGLRTLCLGVKDLTQPEFDKWREDHHTAATAMVDREQKLNDAYDQIEKDLSLVGATAIEDKLQVARSYIFA